MGVRIFFCGYSWELSSWELTTWSLGLANALCLSLALWLSGSLSLSLSCSVSCSLSQLVGSWFLYRALVPGSLSPVVLNVGGIVFQSITSTAPRKLG